MCSTRFGLTGVGIMRMYPGLVGAGAVSAGSSMGGGHPWSQSGLLGHPQAGPTLLF